MGRKNHYLNKDLVAERSREGNKIIMEDLISVIVPVFNTIEYIDTCIKSILAQTYREIEVLLIDDGSSDGSELVCDEFENRDERVRVVHKKNTGVSDTRNLGIDLARGKYIMFVDSDDKIAPNAVENLISICKENKADIVCGQFVGERYSWNYGDTPVVWKDTEPLHNCLQDHPFMYSACAKLFSKDIIGETRFREEIRVNEDSLFVFEICCKPIVFVSINSPIYEYTANYNSASQSAFSLKFFDIIKVVEIKREIINKKYPELTSGADNIVLKAEMNLLKLLCLRTNGEYIEWESKLKTSIVKNKSCYVSAKKSDDRWLFIIEHNLIWLYKKYYKIKYMFEKPH